MWFKALYDELADFRGDELFAHLLEPLQQQALDQLQAYEWLRTYDASRPFDQESSWNWYALSRVHDWLVLDAQRDVPRTGAPDGSRHAYSARRVSRALRSDWNGPHIPPSYVRSLFEALQFSAIERAVFHPFFHEIVAIEEVVDVIEPAVVRTWWDGWMWGDMLFARAGVTVRCAPGTFDEKLATQSPMYFAFARLHRPANDLSHGWGSNSQWHTGFRRDYLSPSAFRYNVDGRWSITAGEPFEPLGVLGDMSEASRIELLRFRSLVQTHRTDAHDLWPFDDRFSEPR